MVPAPRWTTWTRATLAFFVFIFAAIALLAGLELRRPGGSERVRILRLTTTRDARLCISRPGPACIFLA